MTGAGALQNPSLITRNRYNSQSLWNCDSNRESYFRLESRNSNLLMIQSSILSMASSGVFS